MEEEDTERLNHISPRLEHYAKIKGDKTAFHRYPIHTFDITVRNGEEKWTAYTFTNNVKTIFGCQFTRRGRARRWTSYRSIQTLSFQKSASFSRESQRYRPLVYTSTGRNLQVNPASFGRGTLHRTASHLKPHSDWSKSRRISLSRLA